MEAGQQEGDASPEQPAVEAVEAEEAHVELQEQALHPPRPAAELNPPTLAVGQLHKLRLADRPGGRRQRYEVLTSHESDLVCLFTRALQRALYGEVWDALEVKLEEENGEPTWFRVLQDEEGRDRRLAVKRMPWSRIIHLRDSLFENPLRELAALEALSDPGHPNVLQKVEALDDGNTIYLLTPFIDGGELFEWIADEGGAPEDVVKPLFRQIVHGMKYVHNRGFAHADMSLENCLTDAQHHNAYIIDFGMCLPMHLNDQGQRHMAQPDGRRPKPSYCPPEMYRRLAYDGVKVDVFSAGAMLFMMLTGIPPFQRATRADPWFRQLVWRSDVQGMLRAHELDPLPEEAADLLTSMMSYHYQDRPLPEQVLNHPWLSGMAPG